jgi:hypothetical protein
MPQKHKCLQTLPREKEDSIVVIIFFNMNLLFFIIVLSGDKLEDLQKLLQCVKYIIFEFTSSIALLHPSPPIPGTVSTGISFAFTYMSMSMHYLCYFSPPPLPLPSSLTSGQNLFHTPVF